MIHAYDEMYLDEAMNTLGEAVEYAVLFCKIEGSLFLSLFCSSIIGEEFEKGNVKYISGMSGIEIARAILISRGLPFVEILELPYYDYPCEYWIGWILAYYQWYTRKSFKNICNRISYEQLNDLYDVLHEADPGKAVEVFDKIYLNSETNLARLRKNAGFSQSQLAKSADISVRSIQLYEQRKADINKAQYNHLLAISNSLNCSVSDLLE